MFPAKIAGWVSNFKGTKGFLTLFSMITKRTRDTTPMMIGVTNDKRFPDVLFVNATRKATSVTAMVAVPGRSTETFLRLFWSRS